PDVAGTLGERGNVLRSAGRHEEAVVEFDRALSLDPGYAWACGSRALSLEALGRVTEALASLDEALRIDPGYAWAREQRERLRASEGGASVSGG
ncbi:tetratricopeptide repeat protein, partial [Streptomyces sp. NPDC005904]|uniref:tetratricopeptide repeat protein n=1 Tax=Streptomyces sp. NPDC005904 TaxID=3154570 RepID=UPI003405C534